jgi:hypothetical protein
MNASSHPNDYYSSAVAQATGFYEQVDLSGAWTGLQHCCSAGDSLPETRPGHRWVCIDPLLNAIVQPRVSAPK